MLLASGESPENPQFSGSTFIHHVERGTDVRMGKERVAASCIGGAAIRFEPIER